MEDVWGDVKKVKGRKEKQKLKRGSGEEEGGALFLLCQWNGSKKKKVKLKEIKRWEEIERKRFSSDMQNVNLF